MSKWCCTPSGRLKINFDGAFDIGMASGGVGVVVRNGSGEFMGVVCQFVLRAAYAFHMEALAFKTALDFAIKQHWSGIVVESDCALLVSALERSGDDCSEVGMGGYLSIVELTCPLLIFRHVYREVNVVVH